MSASTGKTPNEAVYGFNSNDATRLLLGTMLSGLVSAPAARIEVADAMNLASMAIKFYYDKERQLLFLQPGKFVYLRLRKGYSVPAITSMVLAGN